jgi:hypothetical protein
MATALGLAEDVVSPDEAALTAEFIAFLKEASAERQRKTGGPVRRFNQGRATACVEAEFVVRGDLPGPHRVGLFAREGTYPAFIRFANASSASDEEKDVRGMSISVANVHGPNLTPGQTRQDFVLNSHPVMMAPDTREFLALLRANEAGGLKRVMYFATHLKAAGIARASRQHHTCHLDIPYFSTTPYLFGPGRAVKYVVRPSSERRSRLPDPLAKDYLRGALQSHLDVSDATFDVMIQFHVDEATTPIEDASVEWKEAEHRVARIRIPRQRIDAPGRDAACEGMAFNPWHGLVDHRPLGGMNRARKAIYAALSEFRQGAGTVGR